MQEKWVYLKSANLEAEICNGSRAELTLLGAIVVSPVGRSRLTERKTRPRLIVSILRLKLRPDVT